MIRHTVLIISVLSFFILSACGGEKPQLSGKEIYKKNCVQCHGSNGRMKINGAFELPTSKLSVNERIQVIANGRKIMPPFKNVFTKEELRKVAEYTMTLK